MSVNLSIVPDLWPSNIVRYTNNIHFVGPNGCWSYPLSAIQSEFLKFGRKNNYKEDGLSGETVYLELFRVPFEHPAYPGMGVRAKIDIPQGTCLGFYAGDQYDRRRHL